MKNRILSDFYCGKINPNEKEMAKDSDVSIVSKEMADAEMRLRKMLNTEALVQLERLVRAQMEFNSIIAEENYIDGFKTGALFIMDITDNSKSELNPVEFAKVNRENGCYFF